MTRFTQKEFQFPDQRSAQELATAIWNYELLPARDFNNVKGERIHCVAKKFACVSQEDGDNLKAVREFRHALFTVIQNNPEALTRRGIENALIALDRLATLYDGYAAQSRKHAEVEFIETHNGPAARHTAEIVADINEAENHTVIARKLRDDKELHNLVQALAGKLQFKLTNTERTL